KWFCRHKTPKWRLGCTPAVQDTIPDSNAHRTTDPTIIPPSLRKSLKILINMLEFYSDKKFSQKFIQQKNTHTLTNQQTCLFLTTKLDHGGVYAFRRLRQPNHGRRGE
ncbi:MAG: hypothetical protein L6Q97_23220, partial [Thermoanaerobaculia bacterium]|nr:hypothetical protein [Thermoanaerobaculia bacterium]